MPSVSRRYSKIKRKSECENVSWAAECSEVLQGPAVGFRGRCKTGARPVVQDLRSEQKHNERNNVKLRVLSRTVKSSAHPPPPPPLAMNESARSYSRQSAPLFTLWFALPHPPPPPPKLKPLFPTGASMGFKPFPKHSSQNS